MINPYRPRVRRPTQRSMDEILSEWEQADGNINSVIRAPAGEWQLPVENFEVDERSLPKFNQNNTQLPRLNQMRQPQPEENDTEEDDQGSAKVTTTRAAPVDAEEDKNNDDSLGANWWDIEDEVMP